MTGSDRCSPTAPWPSTSCSTPDDPSDRSSPTELELLIPLHSARDSAAARRLGVEPDQVMTATFRRVHDGVAFCSTRVFLPQDVGELLLDAPELTQTGLSTTATVIGLIDAAADLPITDAEQNISVAPLPGEVAGHLRVPSDVAVLRIDRTYLPDHSYRVRLHRSMH